jgi:hypothetical protein
MTDRNLRLTGKYALLLSISYLLELALRRYISQIDFELVTMEQRGLISTAPVIFTFALNIITSFIVFRDRVINRIETKYVIVATILYRPVGVVAFLIYSIYNTDTRDAARTDIE